MNNKQTEVQRLAEELMVAHNGHSDEGPTSFSDAARKLLDLEKANSEILLALQAAFKALDAIYDEMTVGERYTNAGQYLVDAFPIVREAIAKHGGKQ